MVFRLYFGLVRRDEVYFARLLVYEIVNLLVVEVHRVPVQRSLVAALFAQVWREKQVIFLAHHAGIVELLVELLTFEK